MSVRNGKLRRAGCKQILRGKRIKTKSADEYKRESPAENMMRACFISNDYSKLVNKKKKQTENASESSTMTLSFR